MKTLAFVAVLVAAVPSFAQSHHGRHHHQSQSQYVPPAPTAMSDGDFANLAAAVNAEPFSDRKIAVVRGAAAYAYFSISQVGQLIDLMTYSSERIDVVSLTSPHIIDRYNGYQFYAHLTFSSEKEQVGQILGI